MKHFRILLPLLILVLMISGCGKQVQAPWDYTYQGKTITVYPETHTIVDGLDVYTYEVTHSANDTCTEIHYPNGGIYWWTVNKSGGTGGWSDAYDESRYLAGSVLINALEANQPREKIGNFGVGFFLIILGAANFFLPELPFYLKYGWAVENAKPSDLYITITKFGGIILAVAGLIACII